MMGKFILALVSFSSFGGSSVGASEAVVITDRGGRNRTCRERLVDPGTEVGKYVVS